MVGPAVRLTLATTMASLALVIGCGTPLAWVLARRRGRVWRMVETVVQLPVVLPPAVAGVALLLAFGRRGLLGPGLASLGIGLPFTRAAVILAETFVAAPFYVQAAIAAFRRLDPDLVLVARTLGASRPRVFFTVAVPISKAALAGGAAMSWARALGEFGATLMFAGNLSGRTQTLPLAIYTRARVRSADGAEPVDRPRRGGVRACWWPCARGPGRELPALEVEVQGTIGDLTIELSLAVASGPTVIVGPNGAGKTSALMMVLGALPPRRGRVALDGDVALRSRARHRSAGRAARGSAISRSATRCFRTSTSCTTSPTGSGTISRRAGRARRSRRSGISAPRRWPRGGPTSCRAARRNGSPWRARWRPGRARCCWTSRWRRSTPPFVATCAASWPSTSARLSIPDR